LFVSLLFERQLRQYGLTEFTIAVDVRWHVCTASWLVSGPCTAADD